ncbi:MAG: septal ring lytic transglycosylase RlpA family protein [Actinomycetota bacterium]
MCASVLLLPVLWLRGDAGGGSEATRFDISGAPHAALVGAGRPGGGARAAPAAVAPAPVVRASVSGSGLAGPDGSASSAGPAAPVTEPVTTAAPPTTVPATATTTAPTIEPAVETTTTTTTTVPPTTTTTTTTTTPPAAAASAPFPPGGSPVPTNLPPWGTERESGVASWYDAPERTCAHRTAPFGTVIRIIRLHNGAVTTCLVYDWGPADTTRIIDLSRDSFERLAYAEAGLIDVVIEW